MKPITGKSSINLQPITIAPAAPPDTYFGVAVGMMPGVKVLAAASPPPALALALVAAHVLECLLKAYLSKGGSNHGLYHHNLNLLWKEAFEGGLQVQKTPPGWVDCLSRLHKTPFRLRYSEGVHGVVLPSAEPMATELADLLNLVRRQK